MSRYTLTDFIFCCLQNACHILANFGIKCDVHAHNFCQGFVSHYGIIKYIQNLQWHISVETDRINAAIKEGRVKMHQFLPSGRVVWTVVGRNDEYWLDPDAQYCSCQKFYYSQGSPCHHLAYQREAAQVSKQISVIFVDAEFVGFMSGLLKGLLK